MRHGGRLAVMGEASVWHSKVLPPFLPLFYFSWCFINQTWIRSVHVCVFQRLLCPCDPEVVPHPCSQGKEWMLGGCSPCVQDSDHPVCLTCIFQSLFPAVRNPSGKCLPWVLSLIYPCIARYLHWSLRQFSSYLSFGVCCDFHLN